MSIVFYKKGRKKQGPKCFEIRHVLLHKCSVTNDQCGYSQSHVIQLT